MFLSSMIPSFYDSPRYNISPIFFSEVIERFHRSARGAHTYMRSIFGKNTNTKLTETPTQATQAYNPQTQTPFRTDGTRQAGGYKWTMGPSPDEDAYSNNKSCELRGNNDESPQETLLLKTAQTPYKTVGR